MKYLLIIFGLIGVIGLLVAKPLVVLTLLLIIICALLLTRFSEPQNESEKRAMQEYEKKKEGKKYNNYKYTCPMCKSNKIIDISTFDKALSTSIFGIASNNVGKCYKCDDCKYKW